MESKRIKNQMQEVKLRKNRTNLYVCRCTCTYQSRLKENGAGTHIQERWWGISFNVFSFESAHPML